MKKATQPSAPSGDEIRKARERAALSQTAAADLLGVSLRTWQNWEADVHQMRPAFWRVFLEHLTNREGKR